jgi:small subunit ribosomal protein S17
MSVERKARRQLHGVVTSTKPDKTITVVVERTHKHRRYGKYVRSKKKYMVHDAENKAQDGDLVDIIATRPISKLKRWRLVQVSSRSEVTTAHTDVELGEPEGDA